MNLAEYALRQFASEQRLDIDRLLGKHKYSRGQGAGKGPYFFDVGRNFTRDKLTGVLSKITHIKMKKAIRFSNSLMAICNAFYFAKRYHVPEVILPYHWYIRQGKHLIDDVRIISLPVNERYSIRGDDLILVGQFFFVDKLNRLYGPFNRAKTIGLLKKIFFLDIETEPILENELVIHVRSGDVFDDNDVHEKYGQPPLAFYKKVLSIEKPIRLHLVYENRQNPVIEQIVKHASVLCIPCLEHASRLEDDIAFLLKARVVAVGRGTFMPGITAISSNIERVYYFESGYDTWGKSDIDVIRVRDKKGDYIKEVLRSWRNTKEQRELMVEYSENNLDI